MHHSLNNNLWDPQRRLLNISNEKRRKAFTDILLNFGGKLTNVRNALSVKENA